MPFACIICNPCCPPARSALSPPLSGHRCSGDDSSSRTRTLRLTWHPLPRLGTGSGEATFRGPVLCNVLFKGRPETWESVEDFGAKRLFRYSCQSLSAFIPPRGSGGDLSCMTATINNTGGFKSREHRTQPRAPLSLI